MSKPRGIDLYSISFPNSPNPWKVAIILEELGLEYNIIMLDMFQVKKRPFIDLNPNGRTPVIVDHDNDDFVLWESVAIIQYLVDKYDTQGRLTYVSDPEKYLINQWLFFQSSGQGVYFGQGIWFSHFHAEKLPSVISRYRKEIRRVLGVLDAALEGKKYLVGDKMTIADLSFIPWHSIIPFICMEDTEWVTHGFPNVDRLMAELMELPSVRTVLKDKKPLLSRPMVCKAAGDQYWNQSCADDKRMVKPDSQASDLKLYNHGSLFVVFEGNWEHMNIKPVVKIVI